VVALASGRWMTDAERAVMEKSGVPTVEINYAVGWSGMGYEGAGRRVYPGLSLTVDVSCVLEGEGAPLRLHVVATLPEPFTMARVSVGGELGSKDPAGDKMITQMDDKQVYRQMVRALLEDVKKRVGEAVFGEARG